MRSEERGGRGRGSTDRVMEMLSQRPQIRDILASRWQAQRQESSQSQGQEEHDSRSDHSHISCLFTKVESETYNDTSKLLIDKHCMQIEKH